MPKSPGVPAVEALGPRISRKNFGTKKKKGKNQWKKGSFLGGTVSFVGGGCAEQVRKAAVVGTDTQRRGYALRGCEIEKSLSRPALSEAKKVKYALGGDKRCFSRYSTSKSRLSSGAGEAAVC